MMWGCKRVSHFPVFLAASRKPSSSDSQGEKNKTVYVEKKTNITAGVLNHFFFCSIYTEIKPYLQDLKDLFTHGNH